MAADDNLQFVIRVRGGPQGAADVRRVARSLNELESTTGRVSVTTRKMGEESKKTESKMLGAIATTLRYGAAFTALRGIGGAFMAGFRFDATMEQNTVAFTHFLGSTKAAKDELATLYKIAATTPFQFTDVTTATRRFLAFGFSVQDANTELGIIGDAIAGVGGGAEEINRLVLALGQIKAKGRLQGDELLQLTELGIVGPQQIAAQMGMTGLAFQKAVTAGKVSSEEAIRAINAVLVEQFKGSAAEQSKTLIGQLSTAKDYGAQAAGALVQPLVDFAKSSVLPRLIAFFKDAGDFLKAPQGQGLIGTLGDLGKAVAYLTGAWVAYKAGVWGVNAALAVYEGLTAAALLAGELRAALLLIPAVTSLAEAWWILDAAIEGTWLAALGPPGWIVAALIAIGAMYWKWKWFHNAVNDTFGVIWKMIKAIGQIVQFLAHPFGDKSSTGGVDPTGAGQLGVKGLLTSSPIKTLAHALGFMASGGNLRMGGTAIVGERGPELLEQRGQTTRVTPLATPGPRSAHRVLQPLYLQVDGRTFAEVMVDVGQTAAARR